MKNYEKILIVNMPKIRSDYKLSPCWVGLVVSMSASHTVGCGFTSRPGHTKDHHKNGTNCLPALHACVRVGV